MLQIYFEYLFIYLLGLSVSFVSALIVALVSLKTHSS
jgi:hypothetical protein